MRIVDSKPNSGNVTQIANDLSYLTERMVTYLGLIPPPDQGEIWPGQTVQDITRIYRRMWFPNLEHVEVDVLVIRPALRSIPFLAKLTPVQRRLVEACFSTGGAR